jgi:RNA polymerase sigma-32 factor
VRRKPSKPNRAKAKVRPLKPAIDDALPVEAKLIDEQELPAEEREVDLSIERPAQKHPQEHPEENSEEQLRARSEQPREEAIEDPDAEPKRASEETEGEADEERGALVPFDPLTRYLAEIRRFPLLSREEEIRIAKHYQETHDPADAFKLVTANLRLVVKIAHEFARASRNLIDLIQEGNIGLMEAVKSFDPYRGVRFPSYAVWWVRAYIIRYLMNNWRLVKIGTTQAQRKLFFNLRKESERLEAEGFAPRPQLLAQRIGVKESEVREMQDRMAQSEVSLEQPIGGTEDEGRLLDVLPDPSRNPEEATADTEWREFAREKVQQFAGTLKDKELEIFNARLLAEDPETLQEIGDRFGISRERVRQIETRLKRRLKAFIKSQAADVEQAGT